MISHALFPDAKRWSKPSYKQGGKLIPKKCGGGKSKCGGGKLEQGGKPIIMGTAEAKKKVGRKMASSKLKPRKRNGNIQ